MTIPELEENGFFPLDNRVIPNPGTDMSVAFPCKSKKFEKIGKVTEITLIFMREVNDMMRNKKVTGARFALTISLSALIAILFYRVGTLELTDLFVSNLGAQTLLNYGNRSSNTFLPFCMNRTSKAILELWLSFSFWQCLEQLYRHFLLFQMKGPYSFENILQTITPSYRTSLRASLWNVL